jgi:hypothetical protein
MLRFRTTSFSDLGIYSQDNIYAQAENQEETVEPKVLGRALFYPNPFKQSQKGTLGYRLSKDMDVEVHIYDMKANRIFKNTFFAGAQGGREGYNKLHLDLDTFPESYKLSAGVYFYLLVHEGKVLSKGKVGIIP